MKITKNIFHFRKIKVHIQVHQCSLVSIACRQQVCQVCHFQGQACRSRGCPPGQPSRILANQLTLSQPGGADFSHHITSGIPPEFSDLPTALRVDGLWQPGYQRFWALQTNKAETAISACTQYIKKFSQLSKCFSLFLSFTRRFLFDKKKERKSTN